MSMAPRARAATCSRHASKWKLVDGQCAGVCWGPQTIIGLCMSNPCYAHAFRIMHTHLQTCCQGLQPLRFVALSLYLLCDSREHLRPTANMELDHVPDTFGLHVLTMLYFWAVHIHNCSHFIEVFRLGTPQDMFCVFVQITYMLVNVMTLGILICQCGLGSVHKHFLPASSPARAFIFSQTMDPVVVSD